MDEIKDKIILAVKEAIANNAETLDCEYEIAEIDCDDVDHIAEQVADTLISAGFGDVNWWKRKCKLCEEDWFLQKKQIEHYAESYKEMLQEDLDKYKHRAEVADRALFNMTKKYILAERKIATTKDGQFSFGERLIALFAGEAIKQAEKELAEEKK